MKASKFTINEWSDLLQQKHVLRVDDKNQTMEMGTLNSASHDYRVIIDWAGGEVTEIGRWDMGKMTLYYNGQPELEQAIAWAHAARVAECLHYSKRAMMSHPDILPLLQQIDGLIEKEEKARTFSMLKACGALSGFERLLKNCLPKE